MRTGSGYDVHRLVTGRALVLGGVTIPYDLGLEGHSDADVLVHAVCDALLGAAGLGDIGRHFPDTDPSYKGISSLSLLEACSWMIRDRGYRVANLDCTVMAQAPRLEPFKSEMEKLIAKAAGVEPDAVNVKATTTEGLGFAGRGEGIGAHAVVLITDQPG
ncbi:MAG: 2-C-methyl-D-erythritol 2,4-cyclodiphosphate synthase [Pseudomonadota bacterium]